MSSATTGAVKLTPKQLRAVMVLSLGASKSQAAVAAKVTAQTIQKWMRDEDFNKELSRAMEHMRKELETKVIALGQNSAAVVQKAVSDEKFPDRQLEAAKIGLTASVRLMSRYKELQVEGFVPPPQPLVIFPPETKMPWSGPQHALPEGIPQEWEPAVEGEVESGEPADAGAEPGDDDSD